MADRPLRGEEHHDQPQDDEMPPALLRGGPVEQHAVGHHQEVVMPVRDITRPAQPVSRHDARHQHADPATSDTAFRIAFPITYDIVLDRPDDEVTSSEDA